MKAYATRHTGFTLTELLVAIGLIVVLMLAVSVIFSSASGTIGSGQALSGAMRDLRSVQSLIKKDLDSAAISDGPFFMIRSNVQVAFPNQKDRLSTPGYTATGTIADVIPMLTADLGNGAGPQQQAVTSYGIRTFRQDVLGFFSRGLFQRQTGNDGTFAAPMTSNEAFVWYGHLMLPDNAAAPTYTWPGLWDGAVYSTAVTNPNNFDASQWALGRMQMLLCAPRPRINDPAYQDSTGAATDRLIYCSPPYPTSATDPLWTSYYRQVYMGSLTGTVPPLGWGSSCTQNGNASYAPLWNIQTSRYDVAGTTISDYRSTIAAYGPTWPDFFGYRFWANPFPARPLISASAALTAPLFVPNCSQFVVEFAGDFTTQDPATGFPTAVSPDGLGEMDWVVVGLRGVWNSTTSYAVGDVVWNPAGPPPTNLYRCILAHTNQPLANTTYWTDITNNPVRAIRWYGLPRTTRGTANVQWFQDVVPVRDVLGAVQPFERTLPTQQLDYGVNAFTAVAPNAGGNGLAPYEQYICAWGPDLAPTVPKPRMIRILIKPEDPTGKIDLPWQEMIFKLP